MNEVDQSIQEIKIYGFTVLEGILEKNVVHDIREALIRCEKDVGTDHAHRGTARHVSNLPTLDSIFHQCIDHPRTLPILEYFLDKSMILGSLNSRIVRPGDGYQALHSDIPGTMLNMQAPVMMNTVWMLDDFSPEIGGTRVVPGSHLSGLVEPPESFEVKHIVQPVAEAGSVIIFNGQCWHGGGANTSDRNRHALFGHYRKHMLLFQLDPHDEFPTKWFEGLTQRQKELMRMTHGQGLGAKHAADSHFV